MSGKKQKLLRKQAKKDLLKELDRMQPNQPQQLGLQIINFLEQFIQLCITLTGEKPQSLALTDAMYNAYIQESQRHAEVLGLKTGFKDEEPVFMGVKLVKKSPIIKPTAENMPTTPPEKPN